jgi:hypothetical protein
MPRFVAARGIFFVDISSGARYNESVNMGVLLCLADGRGTYRLIE